MSGGSQPPGMRGSRPGRSFARITRTAARAMAVMLGMCAAGLFIGWDANWWTLRDRIEHIRAALFGAYVSRACRIDPTDCENKPEIPETEGATADEMCIDHPGLEVHCQFQALYAYFNAELFAGRLPPAVITLQRKDGLAGYFAYRRFTRSDGERIDEIAMNPSTFEGASMLRLAATLVHEMVHLEQAHFRSPGDGGYHNEEWGRLMKRVGLHPSATGRPGGVETGIRMRHYILPGGPFERVAAAHPLIAGKSIAFVEGKRARLQKRREK